MFSYLKILFLKNQINIFKNFNKYRSFLFESNGLFANGINNEIASLMNYLFLYGSFILFYPKLYFMEKIIRIRQRLEAFIQESKHHILMLSLYQYFIFF